MPLETATYIDSLVTSNPTGSDSRTTADDHLRLIKAALLRTFTGVTGPVTGTQTTLNRTNDLTSSAQLQIDALKTGKVATTGTAAFADTANSAASAVYAYSANNATSSVFATSASNASSAVYAFSAENASSAVAAFRATNADSAVYAYSAGRAQSAQRAVSASYARLISGGGITTGTINAARIPNSSIGGQGVVELATTAEAAVATDLTRVLSVASFGKPNSLGTNGYYTFPGGFTVAWGTTSSAYPNPTVNFSSLLGITFSTVYRAVVTSRKTSGTIDASFYIQTLNTTTLTLLVTHSGSANLPYDFIVLGQR